MKNKSKTFIMSTNFYAIIRKRSNSNFSSEVIYPSKISNKPFSEFRSMIHSLYCKLEALQSSREYAYVLSIEIYDNRKLLKTLRTFRSAELQVCDIFQQGDFNLFQKVFDVLSLALYPYELYDMPAIYERLLLYKEFISMNKDRRRIESFGNGTLSHDKNRYQRINRWRGTIIYTGMI
jgi:hypothetical protein